VMNRRCAATGHVIRSPVPLSGLTHVRTYCRAGGHHRGRAGARGRIMYARPGSSSANPPHATLACTCVSACEADCAAAGRSAEPPTRWPARVGTKANLQRPTA
jgi:hypothetical protein